MSIYEEENIFTARTLPWMKVGTVIERPVTAAEAMKLADADFDVKLKPVFFQAGKDKKRFEGRSVVVRTDTFEPFGIVSDTYEVIQYREAFEFIDSVNPEVAAAGTLKKGRHAFMVVKLPDHLSLDLLGGDHHDLYVVLRTSHDGSKAVEVAIMPLRGRCMNQLPLTSLTRNAKQRWAVRHVVGAKAQLAEAQKIITGWEAYAAEFETTAKRLAAIEIGIDETQELLRVVLPDRPKREDVIAEIGELARTSPTIEGFHGTGWGAVNAVGEYFDHFRRGGSPESRFTNALSGSTSKYVNRTAQLLIRR